MTGMALLEIDGLRRSYSGHGVLHGLDLVLHPGEIAVLVGGSGSGKTTLLRIVAGLERAEAGRVRLRGIDVDGPMARRFVPPERRGLGMVFQDHALWPHLTVRENVALALPPGRRRSCRDPDALLDAVEMGGFATRRPGTLSGGQQQRVALARALATGSDLVLLDEPLSSLDGMVRDRLRPLIRDVLHRDGRAALLVSHDQLDAWRIADRMLVLEEGRLSQAGTPQALYAAPRTETAARFMGAEGRLSVLGGRPGTVLLADGTELRLSGPGLVQGETGIALAHPGGVSIASEHGLPATRLDSAFEAGLWRTRWRIGAGGDEILGLHTVAPPGKALLWIDPAKLFAFPAGRDAAQACLSGALSRSGR